MDKLVVEILHRNKFTKDYHSFEQNIITIGRGFNNDVILPDQFVSKEHALIQRVEDRWIIRDQQSHNGILLKKTGQRVNEHILLSGEEFILGKTHIRIIEANHAVSPTSMISDKDRFTKKLSKPMVSSLIIVLMVLLYALEARFTSVEKDSIEKLISSAMWVFIFALIWSGIWAFIGRVMKHKARFLTNLGLSCLYLLLFIPATNIAEYLGYFISSAHLETGIFSLMAAFLFIFFLGKFLLLSTNIKKRSCYVASSLICGFLAGCSFLFYTSFKGEFDSQPDYYATIKPPIFQIVNKKSINSFISDNMDVFVFKKNEHDTEEN